MCLSEIESSDFFGLCTDQIKALLPYYEAKRYLTFLILQNDLNWSGLDKISERCSNEEQGTPMKSPKTERLDLLRRLLLEDKKPIWSDEQK